MEPVGCVAHLQSSPAFCVPDHRLSGSCEAIDCQVAIAIDEAVAGALLRTVEAIESGADADGVGASAHIHAIHRAAKLEHGHAILAHSALNCGQVVIRY